MCDILIVYQFEVMIINVFGMHFDFNYVGTFVQVTNWTLSQVL